MNLPSLKKKATAPATPRWQQLLKTIEHLRALGIDVDSWTFQRVCEPAPGLLAQSWPGGGSWLIITGPDAKARLPDDAGRIVAMPFNGTEPPRPLEQLEAALAHAMASPVALTAERLSTFAETFPGLRGKMGVRPWQPGQIARWFGDSQAAGDTRGAHAARFVLEIAHPGSTFGRFNAVQALREWDEPHRAAFLAWAQAPWWPR